MENHDILKLHTYYDYNFEMIESDEFLKTFCKFLSKNNVNEDSNEITRDKNSKFNENNDIVDDWKAPLKQDKEITPDIMKKSFQFGSFMLVLYCYIHFLFI